MQEKKQFRRLEIFHILIKNELDYLRLEIPTTTDELEQVLIQFRIMQKNWRKEFSIEGDVIPMSFIINNGDQDPAILINGFGEVTETQEIISR